MPFSINAWLSHEIDEYKDKMQDATVEFFIAETKINRMGAQPERLDDYFETCMQLAKLAKKNGDDESYLQGLKKIYTRMMTEFNNKANNFQCRELSHQYARESLTLTCQLYSGYDIADKAKVLRTDFVKRSSFY